MEKAFEATLQTTIKATIIATIVDANDYSQLPTFVLSFYATNNETD